MVMNGETILVVDDNSDNLVLIELLLAEERFAVETADSAKMALEVLSSRVPDAMLTDIQMPDVDGLELIRQVRVNPQTGGMFILAVSANAMKENIEEAYAAGCDGYITKPLDTQTFAASVRTRLGLGRRQGGTGRKTATPLEEKFPPQTSLLVECMEHVERLLGPANEFPRRATAGGILHQCAATAGVLGYAHIAALARDLEANTATLNEQEFTDGLRRLADLLGHAQAQPSARAV